MASTISLRTLGSVQVQDAAGDDVGSLLAQPRRTALFVYLVIGAPREFHRRDVLLPLFWPDHDESRGRNALNQAIHFLRRALGADAIVSRGDQELAVNRELVQCDAIAFERALAVGRWDGALDLYRGPFMDGFHVPGVGVELERWVEGERARLAQEYARALEHMADAREAAGDPEGAVIWLRKLAGIDPYSGRTTLRLMQALAAAGQHASAMQQARIHETLVHEELGVPVDPKVTDFTRALQETPPPTSSRLGARGDTVPLPDEVVPQRRRLRRAMMLLGTVGAAILAGRSVGRGRATPLPSAHTVSAKRDAVTYGLYLRGRDAFRSRSPASLRRAVTLFAQATARDSLFAPAYAGLADAYRMLAATGAASQAALADSARLMTARALALDSASSEAHTSLAVQLTDAGEWKEAEAEYRRAIELGPANPLAHHWYATLLVTLGRKDEAVHEIRRAADLDPTSQPISGARVDIERFAGVRAWPVNANPSRLVDPTHPGAVANLSLNLARRGQCAEAFAQNAKARKLAPDNSTILLSLVGVDVLCGRQTAGRVLLDSLERRPDAGMNGVFVAEVFVRLGQPDSAFVWLERTEWTMQSRYRLRVSPHLARLRGDTRYGVLLARMGLR